mmetsp:Transcript_35315/g.77363  ORF Transcript_35315/g.77363 Transcript_35315/m.77363 type:complete len:431 (+) Transcript_35315:321-1613(+)
MTETMPTGTGTGTSPMAVRPLSVFDQHGLVSDDLSHASQTTDSDFLRELLRQQNADIGEIHLALPSGISWTVAPHVMTDAFAYVARDGENVGVDGQERRNDDDSTMGEVASSTDGDTDTDTDTSVSYTGNAASNNIRSNNNDNLPLTTEQDRSRIQRIYFASYSFHSLPERVVGSAYSNLNHVDIRDNDTLQDIGSIVSQLPNLQSLYICDCSNLTSILPIATVPVQTRRRLALKHLWIRGVNFSRTTAEEWEGIFKSLAMSTGPVERLALSRNQMAYLPCSIASLSTSLAYLFIEDMPGITLPDVIGSFSSLRYLSLAGNDLKRLPATIGRLGISSPVDVHVHRNPNLTYPPAEYQESIASMREFFHLERMKVFRGIVRLYPHLRRARLRANERLFEPGGTGFIECKARFERQASSQSEEEDADMHDSM